MEQHTSRFTDVGEAFDATTRPRTARNLRTIRGSNQPAIDASAMHRFERALTETVSLLLVPTGSSPVAEHVRWHFGIGCEDGGLRAKRLRPRLLLQVAFDEGGTFESALDAALAVEFLHNYSLVHDDIEDGDKVRRGRQTVWARYGLPHGVNAGDAISSFSCLTLLRNSGGSPLERVMATTAVLQRATLAMCAGQGYDLGFEAAANVTLAAYLAMIDGKTATLFGAACELGALCAGSGPVRAAAYAQFGRTYGRAFQIRDDIRGLAADIARRKWSFPIVWALGRPPSEARTAIATRYARLRALEDADVGAIVEALDMLGARRAAEMACDDQLREAAGIAQRYRLDRDGTIRELFCAARDSMAIA